MTKGKLITFLGIVSLAVIAAISLPLTPAKAQAGHDHNANGHKEKGHKHGHEAGHAEGGHSNKTEGHSHAKAEQHGGLVTMSTKKEFHFEVVFNSDSVRVYLYDGKQNPVSAKGVSGIISLRFREPGHKSKSLKADLAYINPAKQKKDEHDGHGHKKKEKGRHEQDFLQAKINMAKVQEGNMKADFVLKNIPGKKEKAITFRETFSLGRLVEYACPMKDSKPTKHPGKCIKCGMTLERVAYIYSCPMHPKVTSQNHADKCWICGAKLSISEGHEGKKHEHHEETKHEHGHEEEGHSH